MTVEIVIAFLMRLGLVALFLPFSAYYVLVDFAGARTHAMTLGVSRTVASLMMLAALFIEIVMSLGVLSGVADRFAAVVLAVFCVMTALLYKQFWKTGDFAFVGTSRGLGIFWDFWKNIALAAAFLMVAFGTDAQSIGEGIEAFFANPFASSNPYALSRAGG
ncbi:MAG: DoxX family membrane protein [Pseudomonadota bacterium]